MKKRVGLTLMELLLILGIVVALLSLAIGLAQLGKKIGGKTQCMKNLRQLYLLTKAYEQEFHTPPFLASHLVNWKPETQGLLICPLDPVEGYGLGCPHPHHPKRKGPSFAPHSYYLIYWGAYWIPKLVFEGRLKLAPGLKLDPLIKRLLKELTAPDGYYFVCDFHDLAIRKDGRIERAKRWTLESLPKAPLEFPKEPHWKCPDVPSRQGA